MKLLSIVPVLLLALLAFACPQAQAIDDINPPASFYDGDGHAAKTIGTLTVTNVKAVAQALSVTNGTAGLVLTGMLNVVTPGNEAGTNTITIAAPNTAYLGRVAIIQVSPSTTNLLAIADSGTVALSGAFSGGAGDILGLLATGTGTWTQVFTSNN